MANDQILFDTLKISPKKYKVQNNSKSAKTFFFKLSLNFFIKVLNNIRQSKIHRHASAK